MFVFRVVCTVGGDHGVYVDRSIHQGIDIDIHVVMKAFWWCEMLGLPSTLFGRNSGVSLRWCDAHNAAGQCS